MWCILNHKQGIHLCSDVHLNRIEVSYFNPIHFHQYLAHTECTWISKIASISNKAIKWWGAIGSIRYAFAMQYIHGNQFHGHLIPASVWKTLPVHNRKENPLHYTVMSGMLSCSCIVVNPSLCKGCFVSSHKSCSQFYPWRFPVIENQKHWSFVSTVKNNPIFVTFWWICQGNPSTLLAQIHIDPSVKQPLNHTFWASVRGEFTSLCLAVCQTKCSQWRLQAFAHN